MISNDEIKEKVLKANEEAHDFYAQNHTRSVPYQSRTNTRNYIWNLIKKNLKNHNINAKGKSVLEVACGTGTFVDLFLKLKVEKYYGIDISSKMIELAKQNNKQENVDFSVVSLEEYSMSNKEKYDIIIASSFLHHLVDLEEGLLYIKSMLKPGGLFIGLHEVVNKRKITELEIFDHHLAELFGYNGQITTPLPQRLETFFRYLLQNQKLLKLMNKDNQEKVNLFNFITLWAIKHNGDEKRHYLFGIIPVFASKQIEQTAFNPSIRMGDINLIDYQLNFDFNLSQNEVAQKYGEVIPYCYYNFAELRFWETTMNHDLFIMKKD